MSNPNSNRYLLHGSGKIKVIALHSWMDDAESWTTIMPFLNTQQHTYVFMNVRGYGAAKDVKGVYNLEEIKEDVFQLADALEFSNFHLIGHSMCGMAAQYIALHDTANRIDKVVLVTPVAASGFPADEETKGFLKGIIQNKEVAKMGYGAFTSNRYSDHWYDIRASRHVAVTEAEAQTAYMAMWLEEDFSNSMSSVDKPFLVFAGVYDHPMFRIEVQKQNFQGFQNVVFELCENSGHFPMQEVPVFLASRIESFFN